MLWLKIKQFLHLPLKLHEKAELGIGTWGRQDTKTKNKVTLKLRVYRAATNSWEDV